MPPPILAGTLQHGLFSPTGAGAGATGAGVGTGVATEGTSIGAAIGAAEGEFLSKRISIVFTFFVWFFLLVPDTRREIETGKLPKLNRCRGVVSPGRFFFI